MTPEAVEARRKYYREYYRKNKDRLNQYKREYYHKNKEKFFAAEERKWQKKARQMEEQNGNTAEKPQDSD